MAPVFVALGKFFVGHARHALVEQRQRQVIPHVARFVLPRVVPDPAAHQPTRTDRAYVAPQWLVPPVGGLAHDIPEQGRRWLRPPHSEDLDPPLPSIHISAPRSRRAAAPGAPPTHL